MKTRFNLQLFKGGGSSTTVVDNSYKPTEAELQLQKLQKDYAEAVSPNARWLNDTARQILDKSIGAIQVDFNKLNNGAQAQIANANANNVALANGQLPSPYLANITANVNRGLQGSMGTLLNDLGNRGVLNSSVTSDALNRMSKTAADTISGQQLQYMNTAHDINNGNIANAPAQITTASAAQEAAQTPAINLWQSSLGLNGAGNGTLAAVAGKMGQSKSTTTMNRPSGGGFMGGLFGGLF